MPAKNPRLSVVLPPSLAALLAQMAAETGDSASSLVRDLLVSAEPALQRMLQLIVAAKAAKGQIGGGLAASMDRVVSDLEALQQIADSRSQDMLGDLVSIAEQVRPRRRAPIPRAGVKGAGGVPEGGSTPVPVTRGSGPGKTLGLAPSGGRLFSDQDAEHLAAVASGRKPSAVGEAAARQVPKGSKRGLV